MATKRTDLSLILPVHNEAQSIEHVIQACADALKQARIDYDMIVVENGSTDSSLAVLRRFVKTHKRIRLYTSPLGWGNAVRTAIPHTRGNAVCYMVSDGQVSASSVVRIYRSYQHTTDPGIGLWKIWRTNRENSVRLVNSRLFAACTTVIFGMFVRDINATPKLLRRDLLVTIPLTSENISIDLELLLELRARGIRWVEIPVESKMREAGRSTTKWRTVWEMVHWMILKRVHITS